MRYVHTLAGIFFAIFSMARSGQVSERILALKARGVQFRSVELFTPVDGSKQTDALWSGALNKGGVLTYDAPVAGRFLLSPVEHLSLAFPFEGGLLQLDLARVDVWSDDAQVVTASGVDGGSMPGTHYRGMVRGIPGSWAAISVYDGELMGLINDGTGQIVVGRFERGPRGLHVIYRDRDLRKGNTFTCGTQDDGRPYGREELEGGGGDRTVRCVRYYWEVNYNVFQDKGTVAATTTYATGLFNQSAILFDNDGIDVVLSELFVWDVVSPYTGPTSNNYLTQFGTNRTSFNGDLAHLIGYGGGGGVAWLNTICSGSTSLRMAYSGINSTYANVPTYSWSTMVVTHEAGHNLGSSHTHACIWNGNGTSIDGCGPTAGYPEGSCPTGPLPTGTGGTIMSYCHLVGGVGINLNNGFGPQPTAVIRNAVNAGACLGVCGSTCDAPETLNVSNVLINTATLSWTNIGATNYDLQWRAVGAATWNTVNAIAGNTYALTGLTQGTTYEFQVRANCAAGTSAYSSMRTFTTIVPCPEALEPNNSLAGAANIAAPTTINALIAAQGDLDYYRFTTTGTTTITMSLSGLVVDYDLRLLSSTGTILAQSELGGSASENITLPNAPAGTYYAYVFGYNGAFNANICYALFIRTIASECQAPQGLSVNTVTYNSANVSWASVPAASGYGLRWKPTSSGTWTDVPGSLASPYALTGLDPLTSYDVQVRTVCTGGVQGGSVSSYSAAVSFTTLEAPCSVLPRILMGVSVLLDGPYETTTGWMMDSLRTRGLIPLQEPYTALGYPVTETASTTPAVLAVTGADAIVDWVLVELREASAPFGSLETRAGLLQRDGDIVAPDGNAFMRFCTPAGSYRVAVRHRNHLGCMSASAFVLGPLPATIGFTSANTYGAQAMRDRNGVSLLWAGNAIPDGLILYSGAGNDRDAILLSIGGAVPTNTLTGYRAEDVNLDGSVKYSGSNNDRDVILNAIGGAIPTNSVVQQMP